ncbi:hypothetical protein H920_07469 [Fukomys damarensis]|uniref:Secreted protein n=1 Tax=Fukomys damarensis TaxID=885580 RepID=A0A091DLN3_FUKDA|nr:hypothetical protein H920_07469 [Fukomys damarensis]
MMLLMSCVAQLTAAGSSALGVKPKENVLALADVNTGIMWLARVILWESMACLAIGGREACPKELQQNQDPHSRDAWSQTVAEPRKIIILNDEDGGVVCSRERASLRFGVEQ